MDEAHPEGGVIMPTPAFQTISATHPWQNLNTPQTLWAGFYAICALDVLVLCAAIVGVRVHRDAMQTIGKDTVPSVIHAQHIKSALADMDANAANELLGEPGKMPEAVKTYESRRKEAATALIEAAKNITFAEDEQRPIEAIQVGMGTYERMIQRARDLHEESDADYVNAYREAARVMDNELLPKADELDGVNHKVLQGTYSELSTKSNATMVFLLLMGGALVTALAAIQRFLNKRTRRILNPMLILATLLTLGFTLYTFRILTAESEDLRVAKEDAYDSIHALWQARAVGYAANADESRYLLDVPHGYEHEQRFNRKALALASPPSGNTFSSVMEGVQRGQKVQGFTGYLADESNNITFDGEREAATDTLAKFVEYLRIDGEIRNLQKSGKHAEAIRLCIGTGKDESNFAFDQFDKALDKTLGINQKAFDSAVAEGFSALLHFEIKASIIAVIIALLAFLGLIKRIQEYR
jgi:hypothetical protein